MTAYRRPRKFLVSALMLPLLVACAGIQRHSAEFPVVVERLAPILAPVELQLVLTMERTLAPDAERESKRGEYILGINATEAELQWALLSAQGLPMYSASARWGDRLKVSRRLGGSELLTPQQLLNYLALLYAPEAQLKTALLPGWTLQVTDGVTGGTRLFQFRTSGGEHANRIVVEYSGAAPWYRHISLSDSAQRLDLQLRILGVNSAVSE